MKTSLFTYVDTYIRILVAADHLLTKGVEAAGRLGVGEQEMLDWRLIDDMQPLRFQITVICNFSRQWPARAIGISLPDPIEDRLDVAGFRLAIAAARTFLASLQAVQFEGRDDVVIRYAVSPELEADLPVARWMSVFATTNMFFHLSTAYAILRHHGARIGKADLFPLGL